MSENNTLSLFEEEEKDGKMVKEVEFSELDDFKGYIFTSEEIRELGVVEYEKFINATKRGQIKFIAGRTSRYKDGRTVKHYVHIKKMNALGLDKEKAYFKFVKGWVNPKEKKLREDMKALGKYRYIDQRVYADTIDRAVEEAERSKERRARKKIDYELDDSKGWLLYDVDRDGKVRRKRPTRASASVVDKLDWENAEEKEK